MLRPPSKDETQDPALQASSRERNRLVQEAIAARVPKNERLSPGAVGELLHAVIAGATMQWGVLRSGRLDDFVRARLRDALALLFPGSVLVDGPAPGSVVSGSNPGC